MPHLTTYSFCFNNLLNNNNDNYQSIYPQLNSIFITRSKKYNCLSISGSTTNVFNARADILQRQPSEVRTQ